jgi:hypothetical protein
MVYNTLMLPLVTDTADATFPPHVDLATDAAIRRELGWRLHALLTPHLHSTDATRFIAEAQLVDALELMSEVARATGRLYPARWADEVRDSLGL